MPHNSDPTTVPGPFVAPFTAAEVGVWYVEDIEGAREVMVLTRQPDGTADRPVLCIPLSADGSIPEEVVEKMAKALRARWSQDYAAFQVEVEPNPPRAVWVAYEDYVRAALSAGLSQEDRGT